MTKEKWRELVTKELPLVRNINVVDIADPETYPKYREAVLALLSVLDKDVEVYDKENEKV